MDLKGITLPIPLWKKGRMMGSLQAAGGGGVRVWRGRVVWERGGWRWGQKMHHAQPTAPGISSSQQEGCWGICKRVDSHT